MVQFHRQFDPAHIKLLIFDLDGTLIDSRLDLVHSVNATLRNFGRQELSDEVIASYVGDGAPMLMRRAFGDPQDEAFLKQGLEFFLGYYRIHKLDHTKLYGGVKEMLAAVQSSNGDVRKMAVISNKPVVPSRAIVEALGISGFFIQVYGGNSFATKKPDPEGVRAVLKETGTLPEETLMIGDSSVDVVTGRNAGTLTCGVTYGFAPHTFVSARPDVLVDTPGELAKVLQDAK